VATRASLPDESECGRKVITICRLSSSRAVSWQESRFRRTPWGPHAQRPARAEASRNSTVRPTTAAAGSFGDRQALPTHSGSLLRECVNAVRHSGPAARRRIMPDRARVREGLGGIRSHGRRRRATVSMPFPAHGRCNGPIRGTGSQTRCALSDLVQRVDGQLLRRGPNLFVALS